MLPDVQFAIDARPWPDSAGENPHVTRERRGAMLALLERFIKGQPIRGNYDLKELGSIAARDSMRGYWEFRSQGRMTETRLFGFFARPGAFIGTSFKPRSDFGDKDDLRWLKQREECEAKWQSLAPGRAYLTAPWPVRMRDQFRQYTERADV